MVMAMSMMGSSLMTIFRDKGRIHGLMELPNIKANGRMDSRMASASTRARMDTNILDNTPMTKNMALVLKSTQQGANMKVNLKMIRKMVKGFTLFKTMISMRDTI